MGTLLAKALAQKVTVKEQARARVVSKLEVIATQWVNKAAASGDLRAVRMLLERGREVRTEGQGGPASPEAARGEAAADAPGLPGGSGFESMSTRDLEVIWAATQILDGAVERPPVPLPPADPGKGTE